MYKNNYIKYKTKNYALVLCKNKRFNFQQHLRFKLLRIKNELIFLNKIFSSLYKKKDLTTKIMFFFKKKLHQLKNKNKKIQKLINISQIKLKKNINLSNNIRSKTYSLPDSKKLNKIKVNFGPWHTVLKKIKTTHNFNKAKWIHNKFVNALKVLHPMALRRRKRIRRNKFIKTFNQKNLDAISVKNNRLYSKGITKKKIKYTYKFLPTNIYKQNRLKALTKSLNTIKYKIIQKCMIKTKSNEENLEIVQIRAKWLKLKKPKKKLQKKIKSKHIRFTKKIRIKKTLKISRLNNKIYKNLLLKLATIFMQYYKVSTNTKSIRYYSKYISLVNSQYFGLHSNRHQVLPSLGSLLTSNKQKLGHKYYAPNGAKNFVPRLDSVKKTFTRILQLHKKKRRSVAPYLHQFLRLTRMRKKLYLRPRTFYKLT